MEAVAVGELHVTEEEVIFRIGLDLEVVIGAVAGDVIDARGAFCFYKNDFAGWGIVGFEEGGAAAGFDEGPPELATEPSGEHAGAEEGVGGVMDFEAFEGGERVCGTWFIVELGKGETEGKEAGPVEVAEDDVVGSASLDGFHAGDLIGEIGPGGAVEEEAVDAGPEGAFGGGREWGLPPDDEREIGIEVAEDGVGEEGIICAGELEGDLFAADLFAARASDVAMGGHPCLGRPGIDVAGALNEEEAAGVVATDEGGGVAVGGEGADGFAVENEVDEGGAGGGGASLFPEVGEGGMDLRKCDGEPETFSGCEGIGHDQNLLQLRPSRVMSASAASGPQEPAG